MASRTQVAAYVAEKLPTDRPAALRAAAAWLADTGRKRQAVYLARDVARELAEKGYVLARVTSARPLTAEAKTGIENFIKSETGATHLELETITDESVIGGVRIELPDAELDATVRKKLANFVQGVSR